MREYSGHGEKPSNGNLTQEVSVFIESLSILPIEVKVDRNKLNLASIYKSTTIYYTMRL